ncbi:hypothetical protein DPEC_G00343700 [Dallia pectoralis]|uniref:Uncharacterized protein n=1 Tax=Dallia pectoralis TaxID=75939 RepID=A0ACC2F2Z8_DALPE|nr:hypothetical protein DPEC_G00343700 [Dallia pectoralis]
MTDRLVSQGVDIPKAVSLYQANTRDGSTEDPIHNTPAVQWHGPELVVKWSIHQGSSRRSNRKNQRLGEKLPKRGRQRMIVRSLKVTARHSTREEAMAVRVWLPAVKTLVDFGKTLVGRGNWEVGLGEIFRLSHA